MTGPADALPFPAGAYAAVCLLDGRTGTADLAGIRQVLREDGILLLHAPNVRLRTPPFRNGAPGATTPHALHAALRAAGFGNVAFTAVEPATAGQIRYVDLDDPAAVDRTRRRLTPGPARWWPAVYRATVPAVIVRSADAASPLAAAVDRVGAVLDIDPHDRELVGWTSNLKGKLVARLVSGGRSWILKTPLHPDAAASLRAGAAVLDLLRSRITPEHPAATYLPAEHYVVDTPAGPCFVESLCRGAPWADSSPAPSPLAVGLPEVLKTVDAIDVVGLGLERIGPSRVEILAELVRLLEVAAPELVPVLQRVAHRLVDLVEGGPHLRKGDFTLSNVFLDGNRITGLIDWDETGTTRHRLAPLADLVFSWAWRIGKLDRATVLAAMLGDRPELLPSGLQIRGVLERLEATPAELASGALVSWSDHAYHELQLPANRLRPQRVRSLLAEPCRIIGPLLD